MLNENEKWFIKAISEAERYVKGELELDCIDGDWYARDYREEKPTIGNGKSFFFRFLTCMKVNSSTFTSDGIVSRLFPFAFFENPMFPPFRAISPFKHL